MNTRNPSPLARKLPPLLALAASLSLAPQAFTANIAWNTDAATGNFGDANWTSGVIVGAAGGTAVASSGDALFFDTSITTSLTNDLSGASFAGLTFNSGSSAYTIGGNDFTLTGNITNSGTNLQTINNNIATTAVNTVTLTTGGGNVTLGGIVSGTGGGLTTAGAGTLTLNGANSYTGATTIGAGTTIKVGNASALGSTSGALTLSGSASNLDLNGFSVTKGNFSATTATAVVTSSTAATLTINYQNTANLYSGLSLTGAASLMLNGGSGTSNPLGTGTIVNGTGSIGFQNQTGDIRVNNIATNLGANGTLLFNGTGRIITTTNNITIGAANAIVVNGTGNSFNFQPGLNGNITTNGAWTGSGTITLSQGFQTPTFNFAGNMTGFTGTLILASTGTTTNQGVQYAFKNSTAGQIGAGSAVITQQLNQGSTLNNTIQWKGTGSQTIAFGDLNTTGSADYTSTGVNSLSNAIASTTATFQVGGLNLSSTYAGNIVNGSGTTAINKVGTGTWTLTGANTYTGSTVVDAGTLLVNNTLASIVTVNAGSFGGTGSSSAAVNIGNNTGTADSFFRPGGNAAIGTFTTTAASTFGSDAVLAIDFNSTAATFDKLITAGLTLNGATTLTLADLGSASLTLGQVFTIVDNTSGASIAGTFAGLAEGSTITVGSNAFTISYVGGTGNDITLTAVSAVPEPATYAVLAGLGALGLAALRRRRAN